MNKVLIAAIALTLGTMAGHTIAQDADPAAKAKEICAACHGEDGNKSVTPAIPKLGGQPADYLAKALHDYKTGKRKNPIMGAMASTLTKDEVEALAHYFSKQASELHVKY